MYRKITVHLSAVLMAAGVAQAQNQGSIYSRCAAAIAAGDQEAVISLASTLRRFNTHPAQNLEAAEECVSAAEGKPMRIIQPSGEFVPVEEYDAERDRRAAEREAMAKQRAALDKVREELRKAREAREQEAKRQKEVNRALIADDVFRACNDLYEDDFVVAMTNRVCVDSFSANGHPRLEEVLAPQR